MHKPAILPYSITPPCTGTKWICERKGGGGETEEGRGENK